MVSAMGRPTKEVGDGNRRQAHGTAEQVLESVKTGQQAALEAVRKFVDTVDQALPRLGEAPSRRQRVIDSGLEMAESLVQAQYDFLRNVVQSAGQSLGASIPSEKLGLLGPVTREHLRWRPAASLHTAASFNGRRLIVNKVHCLGEHPAPAINRVE